MAMALVTALTGTTLIAHSGPPFPIVSNQEAGPYRISVWTDPDSTDDGTAGGQFWVTLEPISAPTFPLNTRVEVAIRPLDRPGAPIVAEATPIDGNPARRFVALLMDHEGTFHVGVSVTGDLGQARLESQVDATYDLRPPPLMLFLYLLPFVVVGFLWVKLLLKRRLTRSG
jgi:hypothetical protein